MLNLSQLLGDRASDHEVINQVRFDLRIDSDSMLNEYFNKST